MIVLFKHTTSHRRAGLGCMGSRPLIFPQFSAPAAHNICCRGWAEAGKWEGCEPARVQFTIWI